MLHPIQVNITEKSGFKFFFHFVFNKGTLPLQKQFSARGEIQPLWQLWQDYSIFYCVCSTATNGVGTGIVS